MKTLLFLLTIFLFLYLVLLQSCHKEIHKMESITKENFGYMPDGTGVDLYTLTNNKGMVVKITNYGGIITSILVPDKNGVLGDVVLGYDNLSGYLDKTPYFGSIVGRYGNRIANGKFVLDGTEYRLATNNGPNALHGGLKGFDKVIWEVKEIQETTKLGLELNYLSKDMEEGYPGNLDVTVTYLLTEDNAVRLEYLATTDKKTILNLTNHSYFNLKDGGATPILDHEMKINADRFTPVDQTLIPTGELSSVSGTPFDFRQPHKIGDRINAENEQIKFGGGYDHNFVLQGEMGELRLVAQVFESGSGRIMEVFTTEPGVQFYTGNFLDGTITGKNGNVYDYRHGFCLETQHFPDSPNKANFPSAVLEPGQQYQSTTIYKFSVKQ
jgi:aldose 1-epimerase